jgi:hypothetical protein
MTILITSKKNPLDIKCNNSTLCAISCIPDAGDTRVEFHFEHGPKLWVAYYQQDSDTIVSLINAYARNAVIPRDSKFHIGNHIITFS